MLWDHEFVIKCDPFLTKYERLPPAEAAKLNPPPSIPDDVKAQLRSRQQQQGGQPEGSQPEQGLGQGKKGAAEEG
jgi:hypothetical protein